MTSSDPGPEDELLARERARSAAALAAVHGEADAANAENARVRAELDAMRTVAETAEARATEAEAEVRLLRGSRAVRWATRVRAVIGR